MNQRLRLIPTILLVGLAAACGINREFRPGLDHVALETGSVGPAAVAPESLLVVSYNIQFAEHVDQAVADLRAAGLERADIILLQEMTPEGVEAIARAFGFNHVYHPAAIHPHHNKLFGNAVLSPWPITADRILVLPHPHPWSGQNRIAAACDLDIAGRPVRAVSLHLATAVVAACQRFEQAAAVVDSLVTGFDGAVVVGGDFNTSAPNDVVNIRKYYRHAERLLPVRLPPGCTIRWQMWRVIDVGCKLDHLFVRGLRAGSSGIVVEAAASDHFPIWARVGWNPVKGP